MVIWYISKYAVTPELGQPTRQFFLSKYMAKLGHSVKLISSVSSGIKKRPRFTGKSRETIIDGVECVLLDGPVVSLGFSLKRVFSWVIFELRLFFYVQSYKREKPDVIIVSSLSILTFLSGVYLKRKYKAKLVLEVRDIWPLTLIVLAKVSRNNLFVKILARIEKYGYLNANGIVGTMPLLDIHVREVINKPFLFKCIPMGFDPEFFHDVFDEVPTQVEYVLNSLPKGKFIVGYAGTIGMLNLVDEIISAAKILEGENNIHFAILGDGPLKEGLQQEAALMENVTFYPAINKKYVPLFLQHCNVLVNCWKDAPIYKKVGTSPNKWIDYMISGRPIIVSYGGYQTMINEANCGFFIPPNAPSLLALKIRETSLMDIAELELMGKRGKDFILKNRSYATLAKHYLAFIDRL